MTHPKLQKINNVICKFDDNNKTISLMFNKKDIDNVISIINCYIHITNTKNHIIQHNNKAIKIEDIHKIKDNKTILKIDIQIEKSKYSRLCWHMIYYSETEETLEDAYNKAILYWEKNNKNW